MKLTPGEFEQFIRQVQTALKVNKEWRCGQAMYNILQLINPELSSQICATDLDPFFRNERIGAFLKHICTDEQYATLNPVFKMAEDRPLQREISPELRAFGQTINLYSR